MARLFLIPLFTTLFGCQQERIHVDMKEGCPVTLQHKVRFRNKPDAINLCKEYLGKVVMLVNTASKCAFTPQYEDLERLYATYRDKGFVVLGFPSNDFAQQEPGSEQEIQSFCHLTYGVKFPMFAKSRVKKGAADPVFRVLGELTGRYPKWNFYKYLLDRQGNIAASYSSLTNPMNSRVTTAIEQLLNDTTPD